MKTDPLGDRMKGYERAGDHVLPRRMPVIIRVDGKAFHRWTHGLPRPFSVGLCDAMDAAAMQLCREIQGAQLAYVQSDEISILVHGYKRHVSTPWMDNRQSKLESVSASIAAAVLTAASTSLHGSMRLAYFDGRARVYPTGDVTNYFVWRQQDASRNSIQMLGQSLYSQSALHEKSCAQIQEMVHLAGKNWNDLPTSQKRGRCIVRETYTVGNNPIQRSRWVVDQETPIFTENRDYIEKHLEVKDEDEEPISRFGDYDHTKARECAESEMILDHINSGTLLQALVGDGMLTPVSTHA